MEIPDTPQHMAAVLIAYRETILILLKDAALARGGKPGPWLDELEAESVRMAKRMIGEEMPIEIQAEVIDTGSKVVKAYFGGVRKKLVEALGAHDAEATIKTEAARVELRSIASRIDFLLAIDSEQGVEEKQILRALMTGIAQLCRVLALEGGALGAPARMSGR